MLVQHILNTGIQLVWAHAGCDTKDEIPKGNIMENLHMAKGHANALGIDVYGLISSITNAENKLRAVPKPEQAYPEITIAIKKTNDRLVDQKCFISK